MTMPGPACAEISPAIDYLLGRASTDTELQASAGDEIGGTGVLGHVERVLIAHVDHGRADLYWAVFAPTAARRGKGEAS